jgi:hypothetical protein
MARMFPYIIGFLERDLGGNPALWRQMLPEIEPRRREKRKIRKIS